MNRKLIQLILLSIYSITVTHTQTRDPPTSESFVKFKRGLEYGDVSYSYAHTDFSDRSGSNVKTTTVVRRIGSPKINDKIPQNMIKMPNGNTVQYWPADMEEHLQKKLKNPLNEALNENSYGHYTSYTTNHDDVKIKKGWPIKKDDVKVVYKIPENMKNSESQKMEEELNLDMMGPNEDRSPLQFPMDPALMKAMMRQKVVTVGTKLQSITAPNGQLKQDTANAINLAAFSNLPKNPLYDSYQNPIDTTNDKTMENCYIMSKSGFTPFYVSNNDQDLMNLASAISSGDISLIKNLARKLKSSQVQYQQPLLNFDSQKFIEANNAYNTEIKTVTSEAPIVESYESSSTEIPLTTTTNKAFYSSPRLRFRKRINRRPKLPERMLMPLLTQTAIIKNQAENKTEEVEYSSVSNSTTNPTQINNQVGTRRRYYEHDY